VSSRKATGPAPSSEHTNRNAAKDLRNAGFKVDAADVRRIRQLIERYNPDILPAAMKPESPVLPATTPSASNIVHFRSSES
jgi:hypothetical protein